MAYNMNCLLEKGFHIVYGMKEEEISQLCSEIQTQHPEYTVKITDQFYPKTIGPITLKVKHCISDIICKATGGTWETVREHLTQLDMAQCEYRNPKALSRRQQERASLILDAMNNKTTYLFHDDTYPAEEGGKNSDYYFKIMLWLHSLKLLMKDNGKVIWLTRMSEQELFPLLYEQEQKTSFSCKLYAIEQGSLNSKENSYNDYGLLHTAPQLQELFNDTRRTVSDQVLPGETERVSAGTRFEVKSKDELKY